METLRVIARARITRRGALLALAAGCAAAFACERAGEPLPPALMPRDPPVASVDGTNILLSEVRAAAFDARMDPQLVALSDPPSESFLALRETLVDETLLEQAADRARLKIDESRAEERADRIAAQLAAEFGGEDRLREALAEYRLTPRRYRAAAAARQRRGGKLAALLERDVQISPEEIAAYEAERRALGEKLDQIRLVEIRVAGADAAARSRALALAAEFAGGPKRAQAALDRVAAEPALGASWRDYGSADPAELLPEVQQEVWPLAAGDVSEPREDEGAMRFFIVAERVSARQTLAAERREAARAALLEGRRAEALIEYPAAESGE